MLVSFRSALVAVCLTLAALPFAHADTISLSGSIIATGVLATDFTNSLVTFTAMFTTEQLAACVATGYCNDGPNEYVVDITTTGATFTISAEGYTVPADGNDYVLFTANPDLTSFEVIGIGDSGGRLGISAMTESVLGDNCYVTLLPVYCPVSAGPLFLTSADDSTYTSSYSITTATPEPSTLTLLGTGVLGLAGVVRRRVFKVAFGN
jgi:PEP-CTERM motif